MVDARLTPLAAMGLDHGTLMREGLRLHGGVVYPGIRALSAEKSREGAALPLGYSRDGLPELLYKPDMTLDSRKPANGYMGLYKGPPPGFHKPMLVPGAESLGLERRLAPGEKPSELGLVGAAGGSYLRLPWLSPYPDAGMYPFVDSSKYAALSMYKASLFSQPNPYLPQHLAYQSLCAGGNPAAVERLYYMPHYPPSPISSPLVAPPMRIPAVTVAPTTLVHCQDKGLSVGSRVRHDGSPFGQQLHQLSPHPPHLQCHTDRERPPSRTNKPSRPPSSKGPGNSSNSSTTGGSSNSSIPIDSSPRASSRLPQPAPPPPALIDSSPDGQRQHPRVGPPPTSSTCSSTSFSSSSTSSQSTPHPFYVSNVAPEHPSPARPSPHKPRSRDGAAEPRAAGSEKRASRSPSRSSTERPAHQVPGTKDPAEKPLDLSGRLLELGLSPNGFPAKLEALPPGGRYGLPPNRELLKETLSPSSHPHQGVSSTSSKGPERPEMISTLHSSWVVPTPTASHAHPAGLPPSPRPSPDLAPPREKSSPSVIKHKALERVLPQHRSSPGPRTGESNAGTSSGHNASSSGSASLPHSPKPNGDWPKHSPGRSEPSPALVHLSEAAEKVPKASKRAATTPEASSYKRPCVENGHPPSHLYLPQSEAYLNHSLAYASRYLHYSVPDSMALHSLPMAGKGPVYPHPVLLGSSSLYPAHLAPKHPMPYHAGEYLTYNAQEMAHPLMHPHPDAKPHERGDVGPKPRSQDGGVARGRSSGPEMRQGSQGKTEREAGELAGTQTQPTASSSERIVCIDLVLSDTDGECAPAASKQAPPFPGARINQNECRHGNQNQSKTEYEPKHSPHYHQHHPPSYPPHHVQSPAQRPSQTDRQPEVLCRRSRVALDTGRSSPPPSSPGQASRQEGSPEEQSPPLDLGDNDQSTLRCARTSGERTSGEWKGGRGRWAPPLPGPHSWGKEAEGLREREDSIVDPEESFEEDGDEDDEGGNSSSKGLRRSSLAKRIANSSGFVGDRIKCVTTELYADSSKLSREQRALQMEVISREESNISQPAANWERAMMRFSELELKEKEGGGVCVSASAAGQDLAGGQHRERELERCQHTARLGEREGVRPVYGSNRVPVLQRCGGQREAMACRGGPCDGARKDMGPATEGRCTPPTLSPAEGCVKRRPYDPQPGEPNSHPDKRPKLCADKDPLKSSEQLWADPVEEEDEEVGKLKVCIELKGLRLSKPAAGATSPERLHVKQERPWPPALTPGQVPALQVRKARADDPEEQALSQHDEVARKWCAEALANGAPAAPLTPSQLKDRAPPTLGPISGDRGPKESSRGGGAGGQCPISPVPEPPTGDTPPVKPRRHGDLDKPKGKRPCKTKHTSQREKERERRKELPLANGSSQHCNAALRSAQEDMAIEQRCAPKAKGAASPNHYPGSPVKPCSPALVRAASLHPQANGTGGAPPERASPPAESPATRPIPPEARRLIVNKNAGETLLQRAARLGYEEVVLYCLENHVCEVNHRDYAGYCALHEACARGWLSIVQHLLEHGADINCSAQDGTRPLHDAVENDHVDVVRLLLSYGADPTLSTYSGRDLLKMTHSDSMERFLSDYFADLQGRLDDDPGLCWEFYGSAVCESAEEGIVFDLLADPPGPEDEEDEEDKREMFEFEFSDRPLLPCYNIQVSLSQGPRNWLLLSDVLRRLRLSPRAFRSTFPHMEVVTVAEAEFYRQASLSQLFSCPDELDAFQPDSKELLDLVEGSAELAARLGSTLECLDDCWGQPRDKVKDKSNVNAKLGS
ncbi:LOW QUALITY PROTEIN: BCL-6 corepressor-like [Aplochiton taeniatus]